ncbi:MAG: glycosyltransferase [Pseudomonadota bacterium]
MSFLFSVLIVFSQKWHGKHSHDHDLTGVQKFHGTAVPRIGGIAVVAGVLLGLLAFMLVFPRAIIESNARSVLLLMAASLPAFVAGIAEDFTKTVSVKIRLSATICSALIASYLLGATVDQLDIWGFDALLTITPVAVMVTAFVVAGGANAINIIDGFNGLSVSISLIMACALGVVGWQVGDDLVVILCALAAGAALGFLMLNYPAGKLFLGDGGAYFLGFWVAEIAVLLLVRNDSVNAWQVLAICAYPVIEVLFSIYRRRFVKKRSAGAPDALHLHTLVYRRVVTRLVEFVPGKDWRRNATVAFVIVPVVALMASCSVLVGHTMIGGIVMVLLQAALYWAYYGRLVRGRWRRNRARCADAVGAKTRLDPL